MRRHFSCALLFCLFSLTAFGQNHLTGSVVDGAGQPLPNASVLLLNARDSSLVKGAVGDGRGQYTFENVRTGRYRLSASRVGYALVYSEPLEVGESSPATLPPLTLTERAGQLDGVQVTAKKPFVEQKLDRMVVNVAGSIVGSGSTALEVLEKSPGVTVDYQNERLQLRGKDGVIVLLDGRQSYLSAADLIALLSTMSSDQIETIELITNPPSRYDAAGNSGLVNIRLKKNSAVGTNGALSVAGGSGRYDRERGGLNLNHRTQKWNAFGSYSLNRGGNYWDFYKTIDQPDPAPTDPNRRNYVVNTTLLRFRDLGQNAKLGLDFSPSKTTTVGVVWTGVWSDHRQIGPAGATFRRSEGGPVYLQTVTSKTYDKFSQNHLGNLNFQHQFKDKSQWSADVDLGHFRQDYENFLRTRPVLATGDPVLPPPALRITMPTAIDIRTAKTDYTRPLRGGWTMETGLKTASVKTDNDMALSSGPEGALQPDPLLSNRFRYTERVNAGYLSVAGKWKTTQVQAGLRAEHTHSVANSLTLNKVVTRDYLNLFPTLFVSRPLPKEQTLTLAYSYRINRPDYQKLNPARGYVDPYAYSEGNAFLKPQFTHALELKHGLKNGVFTSLAANYTTDLIFFTIFAINGNQAYVTYQNLDRSTGYTLTLGVPITVTKGWQLQTNWLGYYNRFRYTYEGRLLRIENAAGRLNANNAFTLGRGWTAELNGWLATPAVNGIWASPWLGSVDVGVQKAVGSNLKLKLSGSDLFHTARVINRVNVPGNAQTARIQFDTRVVLLNVSYAFGNQKLKGERQRRLGSEDETRRAN